MNDKTKSILLVDDNAIIRRELRHMFEAAGFVCSESEDGAQAVTQAEHLKPDLIVLDFSMPVMNGLQAAPLLKKKASPYSDHHVHDVRHPSTGENCNGSGCRCCSF
jgi:CheY-like chemotaxis protein